MICYFHDLGIKDCDVNLPSRFSLLLFWTVPFDEARVYVGEAHMARRVASSYWQPRSSVQQPSKNGILSTNE